MDLYQTAGSALFSTDVLKVSADDSRKMTFSHNYQPKSKKYVYFNFRLRRVEVS